MQSPDNKCLSAVSGGFESFCLTLHTSWQFDVLRIYIINCLITRNCEFDVRNGTQSLINISNKLDSCYI